MAMTKSSGSITTANSSLAHPRPGDGAPPTLIYFSLTRVIDQEYELRGVFPTLRRPPGCIKQASTHPLTLQEAQDVLNDAKAQVEAAKSYRRIAYRAVVRGLEWAIGQANDRQKLLDATEAVCVWQNDKWECWKGTKQQLQDKGIRLAVPWPGEPGGNRRWAKGIDWRGLAVHLVPARGLLGRFEASIEIPAKPERAASESERQGKAARAREALREMPANAEAYRSHLIEDMRRWVRHIVLAPALKPAGWHGYQLSEHAVSEIQASFDTVVEAIAGAEVLFDADLHAEIAQRYRVEMAANDDGFQAKFADLTRPRPELIEGSES